MCASCALETVFRVVVCSRCCPRSNEWPSAGGSVSGPAVCAPSDASSFAKSCSVWQASAAHSVLSLQLVGFEGRTRRPTDLTACKSPHINSKISEVPLSVCILTCFAEADLDQETLLLKMLRAERPDTCKSLQEVSVQTLGTCVSRQSVIETAAGVQRLAIEPGPKISNNTICAAYVHCHFCHMSHVYKWCVLFEVPAGICPQSHRLIPRK